MSNDADQAARSLRELDALTLRTQRASRSMATGLPLVGWGFAWIVGLAALDLLDGPARVVVVSAAWLVAMLLSWGPRSAAIRTGSEPRVHAAWVAIAAASPFLVAAAQPATFTNGVLLLCALWGLGMCLFAIATGDRMFAVVAAFGVVLAGVIADRNVADRLLWFGIAAGAPLLALGVARMRSGVSSA